MYLPQHDGTQFVRTNRVKEFSAIIFDLLPDVPIREAEIQQAALLCPAIFGQSSRGACSLGTVRRKMARAARSGAESVDKPVEFRQRGDFENLQFARSAQLPSGI